MKKTLKAIQAAAVALVFALLLCSCTLSDLFAQAGITAATASTSEPDTGTITYPETLEDLDGIDMSAIDLTQYMTLEYKGIGLVTSYEKRTITDDILKSELTYLLVQSEKYELITEGKTAEGDWLEISFTGIMDGEEFSGGSSDKATILLDTENSGYIDGFADGLIGKNVGETVALNLVFPETYYSDLAGKQVTFNVTIKGICSDNFTDTVASELSEGKYTTVSAFREYFRQYLEELEDSQVLSDVYSSIWTILEAQAVFTGYPKEQYDYYYNYYVNYIISYAQYYGIDYDTALEAMGQTDETLKELALDYVHQDMILNYIANAEGIELTDEAYRDYLDQMVTYYNSQGYTYTAEQLEESFNSYYGDGYLKSKAFEEKVCMAVYNYATVTYVPETSSAE